MFERFLARLKGYPESLRFKHGPKLVRGLSWLATSQAQAELKQSEPINVLVDNSVLGHGITHETAWISTGVKKWGPHDVETGYAARIPVHADDDDGWAYQNIRYLIGIAYLARHGHIHLKTSGELRAEQFHQPGGRFSGYGYYDYNLFGGITMPSVDGIAFPTMGPSFMNLPSSREQQFERIKSTDDALFQGLLKRLGEKNSLDAWHIRTAERHGLFCFLTMDRRLCNAVSSQARHEPLCSLRTKVMTPLEFGQYFKIHPLPPRILSYNNASFPVRSDLNWNGKKGRRKPRRHAERD